jgi:hypothetical protein
MDIEKLRRKKQLNVQEQNELVRQSILETAQSFQSGKRQFLWIRLALEQLGYDAKQGMLASISSMPCGGVEEAAYACWVTSLGRVFEIDATIQHGSDVLISVDRFEDVTEVAVTTRRGTGKAFGLLATESLAEALGSN